MPCGTNQPGQADRYECIQICFPSSATVQASVGRSLLWQQRSAFKPANRCLLEKVDLLCNSQKRALCGGAAGGGAPPGGTHHPHCTHHACMSHPTFLPLQVEGRGTARMDTLKVGDRVLTLAHNGSLAYE
jgi:hypothetical protein